MDRDLRKKYGYPTECDKCKTFDSKPKGIDRIDQFYKSGNNLKILLIGQDPTIFDEPDRVNSVTKKTHYFSKIRGQQAQPTADF